MNTQAAVAVAKVCVLMCSHSFRRETISKRARMRWGKGKIGDCFLSCLLDLYACAIVLLLLLKGSSSLTLISIMNDMPPKFCWLTEFCHRDKTLSLSLARAKCTLLYIWVASSESIRFNKWMHMCYFYARVINFVYSPSTRSPTHDTQTNAGTRTRNVKSETSFNCMPVSIHIYLLIFAHIVNILPWKWTSYIIARATQKRLQTYSAVISLAYRTTVTTTTTTIAERG